MREVFVLARARGVCVADEAVEKALALIDHSPEQATASHVSLCLPAPAGAQGARGDRLSHVRGALFNLFM